MLEIQRQFHILLDLSVSSLESTHFFSGHFLDVLNEPAVILLIQLKATSPLIFIHPQKHTTPSAHPSHFPTSTYWSCLISLLLQSSSWSLVFDVFRLLRFKHRSGFSPCKTGGTDCWSEQHQKAWRLQSEIQLQWNWPAQVKSKYFNHFIYTYYYSVSISTALKASSVSNFIAVCACVCKCLNIYLYLISKSF